MAPNAAKLESLGGALIQAMRSNHGLKNAYKDHTISLGFTDIPKFDIKFEGLSFKMRRKAGLSELDKTARFSPSIQICGTIRTLKITCSIVCIKLFKTRSRKAS